MAYFDAITKCVFQKNPEGKTIFFPWGMFLHGYILDSAEREIQLKKAFQKFVCINFFLVPIPFLIIALSVKKTPQLGLLLFVVFFIGYSLWAFRYLKRLTQNLNRSATRLMPFKTYQSVAKDIPLVMLALHTLFALALCAFAIYQLYLWQQVFFSLLVLLIMGWSAFASSSMIYFHLKR
jgi:cbb3-type cytochrome oxidase subunit 3